MIIDLNNSIVSSPTTQRWSFKDSENIHRFKIIESEKEEKLNYTFKEILGVGAGSIVWELEPADPCKKNKALKILKIDYAHTKSIENEVDICPRWPNKSTGLMLHPKGLTYLLCKNGGTLHMMVLHKYEASLDKVHMNLDPETRMKAVFQILQGFFSLRELHIAHGDLHAGNIFCDLKGDLRFDIGDFESSLGKEWGIEDPDKPIEWSALNQAKFEKWMLMYEEGGDVRGIKRVIDLLLSANEYTTLKKEIMDLIDHYSAMSPPLPLDLIKSKLADLTAID